MNLLIVTEMGEKTSREDQVNLLMDEYGNVEALLQAALDCFINFAQWMSFHVTINGRTEVTFIDLFKIFRDNIMEIINENN
jgi:hypothetical protein